LGSTGTVTAIVRKLGAFSVGRGSQSASWRGSGPAIPGVVAASLAMFDVGMRLASQSEET
jgi:hypothetical protein